MITYRSEKFIEYKLIKLDKNIHLAIYEDETIEVFGPSDKLIIHTNKHNKKYIICLGKIIFIDKYLN
jgi:hypothetical protein